MGGVERRRLKVPLIQRLVEMQNADAARFITRLGISRDWTLIYKAIINGPCVMVYSNRRCIFSDQHQLLLVKQIDGQRRGKLFATCSRRCFALNKFSGRNSRYSRFIQTNIQLKYLHLININDSNRLIYNHIFIC